MQFTRCSYLRNQTNSCDSLVEDGTRAVTGGPDLKNSQAYPKRFGLQVATSWHEAKDMLPRFHGFERPTMAMFFTNVARSTATVHAAPHVHGPYSAHHGHGVYSPCTYGVPYVHGYYSIVVGVAVGGSWTPRKATRIRHRVCFGP